MLSDSVEFHRLIAKIYETAADPELWPELLDALVECVDLDVAVEDDAQVQYDDLTSDPDSSQLDTTPSSSLALALRRIPRFSTVTTTDSQKLVEIDVDYVGKILLQHFKCALNVAQRLADYEDNKDVLVSVLDQLPIALLVVDSTGRILECNPQARKIAEQESGIYIRNSYLSAISREAQEKLSGAILRMSRKAASSQDNLALTLPVDTNDGNNILAFLSPVKGTRDSQGLSNVAVFLSWPKSQPFTIPRAICELYALTPVEVEIISMLVRGYCIKEIAVERCVSEHTIRSQVKSVLAKTKTARQSDLFKLVLSGPASDMKQDTANDGSMLNRILKDGTSMIKLADGRALAYKEYGEPDGEPLIYLHSVLGCRLEFECFEKDLASKYGFRVICPDRPGFGLSDPLAFDSFLDWSKDLEQLAVQLGLEQYSLAGYAMGAIFACAAANVLPQSIKRVLVVSSGVRAKTREDFAKMTPLYRMANKLARDFPQVSKLFTSLTLKGALRNPQRFFERYAAELPQVEARLFRSEAFRHSMINNLEESLQQGSHQVGHEIELLARPWDFSIEEITVPVDLWHGSEDRHVTCILSEKMTNVLPNASLKILPDHGHYMIYHRMPEILHAFSQNLEPSRLVPEKALKPGTP